MQYLLQIFSNGDFSGLTQEERQAVSAEYFAISDRPGVTGGAQLQPVDTATTVRVQDGRTLTTDGPFPETKEALGGLLPVRGRRPRRGDRARIADPRRAHGRRGRGATAGGTLIEQVFREQWGRVLATLIGLLGDFELAEEAAQEAFAVAAERWPREGTPSNPSAWLDHDGPQPRDRPDPSRAHGSRRRRSCSSRR